MLCDNDYSKRDGFNSIDQFEVKGIPADHILVVRHLESRFDNAPNAGKSTVSLSILVQFHDPFLRVRNLDVPDGTIEQKIDHRLNWLMDAEGAPLDVVSLIPLPACRIVWVDDPLKIDGSADMETPIRKLDQSDAEAVVFLGKVGLGISVEHLQKAETAQYDGIFLILDQEDIYTGGTLDLPETLCVRLRFRGSHAEAPAQYQKLLDYIDKHKMQIVGFSREVTLIDYGVTNDAEKFVTEICIPVKCE